jgi:PPOX class probable F420-dependent enzyme
MPSQRDRIRMTGEEALAFLAERRKVHVATLNRDGSAHLVPMYFLLVAGAVTFWTYSRSQKARNLERDPRITVMAEDGDAYFDLRGVQVRGLARLSTDPAEVRAFGEGLHRRYFGGLGDAAREHVLGTSPKRTLVTVVPARIVSWDHTRLLPH